MLPEANDQSATDENNDFIIQIRWGGFYTSKEDGEFGLFRLLDFNSEIYHIQLFREKFDHAPSFDEVKGLKPFAWHVPIVTEDLINRDELALIGHEPLNEETLSGYEEYLRHMGASETAIKELIDEVVSFSTKGPVKFKLSKSDDRIVVARVE